MARKDAVAHAALMRGRSLLLVLDIETASLKQLERTTGPRLKLDLRLIAFFVFAPLLCQAIQKDLPDPNAGDIPLVEIEYGPDVMLPYKERRDDWGRTFGFRFENYNPSGYQSDFDLSSYKDLFGENTINMFGLQGGVKYNLSFGSLTAEGSYQTGSISDSRSGGPTTLSLTKMGGHFGLWLDMIFSEPYVVPYAQLDVYQIDYQESGGNVSQSGTSGALIGWTTGTLLQLNWLDEAAALRALYDSGLDNAYIDLFMTQSQASKKPDLATAMTWGAGVKLEF